MDILHLILVIFWLLDVDSNVNSWHGSKMLEEVTSPLRKSHGLVCVFTVVNNVFVALECTQHTNFDVIIAHNNYLLSEGIKSANFVRLLRNIGDLTPFIVLFDDGDDNSSHSNILYDQYCSTMTAPFTPKILCDRILSIRLQSSETEMPN